VHHNGHVDIVCVLLDAGAMVNAETDDGCTPLNVAIRHNHHDIARLLMIAVTTRFLLSKDVRHKQLSQGPNHHTPQKTKLSLTQN
jgi:ankyrin repeat protein